MVWNLESAGGLVHAVEPSATEAAAGQTVTDLHCIYATEKIIQTVPVKLAAVFRPPVQRLLIVSLPPLNCSSGEESSEFVSAQNLLNWPCSHHLLNLSFACFVFGIELWVKHSKESRAVGFVNGYDQLVGQ